MPLGVVSVERKLFWLKAGFSGFCVAFLLTGAIFWAAGSDSPWQFLVVLTLWMPATVVFRHALPHAPWHRQ